MRRDPLGLSTRGLLRAEGPAPRDRFVDGPRLVWLRPVVALGAAVALLAATVAWQAPRGRYVLAVLPLGASQGLLLTTPGGSAALIDAGDTPSALNAALGSRLPFWRTRLDMMALSGVDRAHVGGLRDLLARYSVDRALDPGAVYPAADYVRWRAALRAGDVVESKLRAGARYALGRDAHLDALLPRGLDPDAPDTPVALRLVFGRLSALLLNRAALAYPGLAPALQVDGVRHDTVLVLSGAAGAADPRDIAALVRLLRPRLVMLPPPTDTHDDPAADALVTRVARSLGVRVWQTTGHTLLELVTDGSRYDIAVGHP